MKRQYSTMKNSAMKKFIRALGIAALISLAGGGASAADIVAGKKIAKARCAACHTFNEGGRRRIGPTLFDMFARGPGKVEGFRYSKGLQENADKFTWTQKTLEDYLADPSAFLRKISNDPKVRSRMTYRLTKKEDRENVIAYLRTLK